MELELEKLKSKWDDTLNFPPTAGCSIQELEDTKQTHTKGHKTHSSNLRIFQVVLSNGPSYIIEPLIYRLRTLQI